MKWDKVEELEHRINAMIRDTAMYEKLTVPVCAFITFESDDGQAEALAYAREVKKARRDNVARLDFGHDTIFNRAPKFVEAADPTNIIWENRSIKGWAFTYRLLRAAAVIAAVLLLACLCIVALKARQLKITVKYPTVDCASLFKAFGNDVESKTKYAFLEERMAATTAGGAPLFGNL